MGISTTIHNVEEVKATSKVLNGFISLQIEVKHRAYSGAPRDYMETAFFLPPGMASKSARIAAAINEIWAEDDSADAPLVEAIAEAAE